MIRKMMLQDCECIAKIDEQCFPVSWSKEQYKYEVNENEFAHLYVMEEQEKCIGFIDFWIVFDSCQLSKIAILPEYRKNHYACLLMDKMIEKANLNHCENISLEVRVSNHAAHKLYESYDFIKVNVRKAYYQDNGEDADFLIKALGENCL